MNNYSFWEKYLEKIKYEIINLCNSKNEIFVDFHIHSNYSSDGKQSIKEIIDGTKSKGFDIIAITDHDTLDAYDEIYEYVKEGLTNPIIVPGIEFTIDNCDYGNQCHLLQLFINPKEESIKKNVLTNYKASFNRSKIQFKRLNENLAIKEICEKNNIDISYEDYVDYLNNNCLVPEYTSLCLYLIAKFKKNSITTFDILTLLEKYNVNDIYIDRQELKNKQYIRLRSKYPEKEENNYNPRFLLSMLAVKQVDDDWWDGPSSGSLSVNSYGQLKVNELNNKYNIFFAHPEEKKLAVVKQLLELNNHIIGLELNRRSEYDNLSSFYKLLNDKKMLKVIGSDSHDNSLQFYDDMEFYKISANDLKKIIDVI